MQRALSVDRGSNIKELGSFGQQFRLWCGCGGSVGPEPGGGVIEQGSECECQCAEHQGSGSRSGSCSLRGALGPVHGDQSWVVMAACPHACFLALCGLGQGDPGDLFRSSERH